MNSESRVGHLLSDDCWPKINLSCERYGGVKVSRIVLSFPSLSIRLKQTNQNSVPPLYNFLSLRSGRKSSE